MFGREIRERLLNDGVCDGRNVPALSYPASRGYIFAVWDGERKVRASQGGYMFPCSLEKIGVFPLFPKNKLRCSLKFTFIKFPCSQKFCCMFPWSPEILINVPQNFNHVSAFDGQNSRKFYLVSHSRDNPQQNACMTITSHHITLLRWGRISNTPFVSLKPWFHLSCVQAVNKCWRLSST